MDRKKLFVSWNRSCFFKMELVTVLSYSFAIFIESEQLLLSKKNSWSVLCRPDSTQRNQFLIFWQYNSRVVKNFRDQPASQLSAGHHLLFFPLAPEFSCQALHCLWVHLSLPIPECFLCARHSNTRSLPSWSFWSSDEVEISKWTSLLLHIVVNVHVALRMLLRRDLF